QAEADIRSGRDEPCCVDRTIVRGKVAWQVAILRACRSVLASASGQAACSPPVREGAWVAVTASGRSAAEERGALVRPRRAVLVALLVGPIRHSIFEVRIMGNIADADVMRYRRELGFDLHRCHP